MKKLIAKLVAFLIKKKVQTITGEISKTSKTKIFMSLVGLCMTYDFIGPYFGLGFQTPEEVYKLLYTLAGISYAERQLHKG